MEALVLERCSICVKTLLTCGDGCCSWYEYDDETVQPGEVLQVDEDDSHVLNSFLSAEKHGLVQLRRTT